MKSRKWVLTGVALFAVAVLCLGFTALTLLRDYRNSDYYSYDYTSTSQSNVDEQYEFNQGDSITVRTDVAEIVLIEETRGDISFEYSYGQLLYGGQPTTSVESSRSGSGVVFTEKLLHRVRVQLTPFEQNSRLVVRIPAGRAGDVNVRGNFGIKAVQGIDCQKLDLNTGFGGVSVEDAVVDGNITLHSASGSIKLISAEVGGDVKLTTSFGGIDAQHVAANNLSAVSSSGGVTLDSITVIGEVKGDTSFGTVSAKDSTCRDMLLTNNSGSVHAIRVTVENNATLKSNFGSVLMNESTAKSARLNADSGGVSFEKSVAEDVTLDTNFGKVLFDPASGCNADLSTDSGRVEVIWPENTGITIDAHTDSGRITINFDGDTFSSERYVHGDGAFTVKARSNFGGIIVSESSSAGR